MGQSWIRVSGFILIDAPDANTEIVELLAAEAPEARYFRVISGSSGLSRGQNRDVP